MPEVLAVRGDGTPSAAYAAKPADYFAGARTDFVDSLPAHPAARILEIGCGSGATGALAKARGKAGYYCGVELFPAAADEARRHLDQIVVGDVERIDLPWTDGSFDALIMSEVLEHLIEPWDVVARAGRLVRPGGVLLASSPNVAHWRVIVSLLGGRFELADRGVFDRTHMRWFTPQSFRTMVEGAGFLVTTLGPVTPFSARTRILSGLTGGRLDHLFMTQIAISAVRS